MALKHVCLQMADEWFEKVKKSEKTCMIQNGRRKIHYLFLDGKEMAEEYDMKNILVCRKWREKTSLGGYKQWEVEIGDPLERHCKLDAEGLTESSSNPVCIRKDTPTTFQWRIRNISYPLPVYSVAVDESNRFIVVKTSNKKFYKKLNIPDMDRIHQSLDSKNLRFAHSNNTLIVTYEKPEAVLKLEKDIQQELSKHKAMKEGDIECNPS